MMKELQTLPTNSADFKRLYDHTKLKQANMAAKVNLDQIPKLPRRYSSLVIRTTTWLAVKRLWKILLHLKAALILLLSNVLPLNFLYLKNGLPYYSYYARCYRALPKYKFENTLQSRLQDHFDTWGYLCWLRNLIDIFSKY